MTDLIKGVLKAVIVALVLLILGFLFANAMGFRLTQINIAPGFVFQLDPTNTPKPTAEITAVVQTTAPTETPRPTSTAIPPTATYTESPPPATEQQPASFTSTPIPPGQPYAVALRNTQIWTGNAQAVVLAYNEAVWIIDIDREGWYLVEFTNGVQGLANPSDIRVVGNLTGLPHYVAIEQTQTSSNPGSANLAPVVSFDVNVNVRSGPGTNYPALGVFTAGQSSTIIAINTEGDWYKVVYRDGEGWVMAAFSNLVSGDLGSLPIGHGY